MLSMASSTACVARVAVAAAARQTRAAALPGCARLAAPAPLRRARAASARLAVFAGSAPSAPLPEAHFYPIQLMPGTKKRLQVEVNRSSAPR